MFIWKKERRANSKANIFLESSRKNHTLISENNECFHPFTCAVSVFASNLNWKNPGASAKENNYFCSSTNFIRNRCFGRMHFAFGGFANKKCTLCLRYVSDSELTNSLNVNAAKKNTNANKMKQVFIKFSDKIRDQIYYFSFFRILFSEMSRLHSSGEAGNWGRDVTNKTIIFLLRLLAVNQFVRLKRKFDHFLKFWTTFNKISPH